MKSSNASSQLGLDPWGSRFDDHAAIADIRARTDEITFKTQDGRQVALPDLATAGEGFDFRKWLSEQGAGEMVGPKCAPPAASCSIAIRASCSSSISAT